MENTMLRVVAFCLILLVLPRNGSCQERPVNWDEMEDTDIKSFEFGIPLGTTVISDILPDDIMMKSTGNKWEKEMGYIARRCEDEPPRSYAYRSCFWDGLTALKEKADMMSYTMGGAGSYLTEDIITMAYLFQTCDIFNSPRGPDMRPHCPSPCAANPCPGSECKDDSQFAGQYTCSSEGINTPESPITIRIAANPPTFSPMGYQSTQGTGMPPVYRPYTPPRKVIRRKGRRRHRGRGRTRTRTVTVPRISSYSSGTTASTYTYRAPTSPPNYW